MNRVMEIRDQIKVYEDEMQDIQSKINALKLELADLVLQGENPHLIIPGPIEVVNAARITIVNIKFNESGKTYDYIWDSDEEVKIGDIVEVENRWGGFQQVEVVNVCTVNNTDNTTAWAKAHPINNLPF